MDTTLAITTAPAARTPDAAELSLAAAVSPARSGNGGPADWSVTFLDELMARVGVDGLVAALRQPALLATVRQHAVGVRGHLAMFDVDVTAEALAGYGSVVLVTAQRCGRVLPADPGALDWAGAEWYLLRLVAVCAVAEEAGLLP